MSMWNPVFEAEFKMNGRRTWMFVARTVLVTVLWIALAFQSY